MSLFRPKTVALSPEAPSVTLASPAAVILPTEEKFVDGANWHYQVVILREDMLEAIRQIVREEIERSHHE